MTNDESVAAQVAKLRENHVRTELASSGYFVIRHSDLICFVIQTSDFVIGGNRTMFRCILHFNDSPPR